MSRRCFYRNLRVVRHFAPCPGSGNATLLVYPPRTYSCNGRYIQPPPTKYIITCVIVPTWDENLQRQKEGEWTAGSAEMYIEKSKFEEETGGDVIITELDRVLWNENLYKVEKQDAYNVYSNTAIYRIIKLPNEMLEND